MQNAIAFRRMESVADESVTLGLPREGNLDTQSINQISSPPHQLIHCGTPKKSGITPFVGSSYTPYVDATIKPFEGMFFDDLEAAEEFYKTYAHSAGFGVRVGPHKIVNGVIRWKRWMCSRQGFRYENKTKVPRLCRSCKEIVYHDSRNCPLKTTTH